MADNKPKLPTHEIKIEVEEVAERALYLHEHLGDGSLGETKFDASTVLPDRSFLITVNGKRYIVHSKSVITGVIDLHEKNHQPSPSAK